MLLLCYCVVVVVCIFLWCLTYFFQLNTIFFREIVLSETLSTELWNEIEERGVVQAEGIARLGYALTGRPIHTSDAVDELWAADEDGNNIMSSSEFLNYSADKLMKDVDVGDWNKIHTVYGSLASRLRRDSNIALEPHANLLLARENREQIDDMCSQLILNELEMEKTLTHLEKTYDFSACKNDNEKKTLTNQLAYECSKYQIKWGSGDVKTWDCGFGHRLLRQLAELKVMEKSGAMVL